MVSNGSTGGQPPQAQVQPCRYKTGKTLGAGSYSVVKECVHIDTGRYYAAKVINKRLMAGREHMVRIMWGQSQAAAKLTNEKVRNEIAVLKRVSMGHRNILTLVDYFETMNNRRSRRAVQYRISVLTRSQSISSLTLHLAVNCSTASVARVITTSPMLATSSEPHFPPLPTYTITVSYIAI